MPTEVVNDIKKIYFQINEIKLEIDIPYFH